MRTIGAPVVADRLGPRHAAMLASGTSCAHLYPLPARVITTQWVADPSARA